MQASSLHATLHVISDHTPRPDRRHRTKPCEQGRGVSSPPLPAQRVQFAAGPDARAVHSQESHGPASSEQMPIRRLPYSPATSPSRKSASPAKAHPCMAAVPLRLTTRDGQSLQYCALSSHGGLEIMRRLVRLVARSSHSPAIAAGECRSELARGYDAAPGELVVVGPTLSPCFLGLVRGAPQTVLEPKQSNTNK
jgi:hypothetical protein